MKIIDNDPICLQQFKKFKWKGRGGDGMNMIYVFNKKLLIKKCREEEVKKLIFLDEILKPNKSNFNNFFSRNYKVYKCNDYYFVLMRRYSDSIKYINFKTRYEFKNMVLQILLFTLYLNFKLSYFHNDLHGSNILFEHNDKNFSINLEGIKLNVGKYVIKVIDWERSSNKFSNMVYYYNSIRKHFNDKLPRFDFFYVFIRVIIEFKILGSNVIRNSMMVNGKFDIKRFISDNKKKKILGLVKGMNNEYTLENFIKVYKNISTNFSEYFENN